MVRRSPSVDEIELLPEISLVKSESEKERMIYLHFVLGTPRGVTDAHCFMAAYEHSPVVDDRYFFGYVIDDVMDLSRGRWEFIGARSVYRDRIPGGMKVHQDRKWEPRKASEVDLIRASYMLRNEWL